MGGKDNYIKIDINKFSNNLAKKQGLWANNIFYYTAPPFQSSKPSEEERKRRANYDNFINKISKIPKIIIREGRCQKLRGKYHQK